jgi:hypothetical protein
MTRFDADCDIIGSRVPSSGVTDLPLFNASLEVQEARERAIQAAHDHANEAWKQAAYSAIVECARRLARLTSDDVWDHLQGSRPATHNPSALGPLFRIAARRGVIQKSGAMVPTRLERRHREVTEWVSLICEQEAAA